jgi:hypothetical protein
MARRGSRIAARLRRRWGPRRGGARGSPPGEAASPPTPLATLRGLGDRPAPSSAPGEAAEAELDTLRGELVRELDRLAEGDDGSGSFRRIAS